MEKKTVATAISSLLILFLITVIGASFSAYKVSKQKVELKGITLVVGNGISTFDKKGNPIIELDIKSNEMGVRPATGEQDRHTNIPSTVNNTIGTEGAYAVFYLTSEGSYEIKIKSVEVTCGREGNEDNIFIGIMDDKSEAVSIDKLDKVLQSGESANNKEIVLVVWLDGDVTNSIVGADIYFILEIVSV